MTRGPVTGGPDRPARNLSSRGGRCWPVRVVRLGLLAAAGVSLGVGGIGCERQPDFRPAATRIESSVVQTSLAESLDPLTRLDEFERAVVFRQTSDQVDRWLAGRPAGTWEADPLAADLPAALRATPPLADIATASVTPGDLTSIVAAIHHRDLANWIVRRPSDAGLGVQFPATGLAKDDQSQATAALVRPPLEQVLLLWDWTVRSIAPAETPGGRDPYGDVAGQAALTALLANRPPPAGALDPRDVRGPGDVLLYGQGNAWQRARTFVHLCRQRQIEAALLGVVTADGTQQPRCVAVLVDGRAYLFDPRLGLPIPAADGSGVATLADLAAKPEAVTAFVDEAGADATTTLRPDDLGRLVVFVEADAFSLTRRAAAIDEELRSGMLLRVAVRPTAAAEPFRKLPGVTSAAIWHYPLLCDAWPTVPIPPGLIAEATAAAVMREAVIFDEHLPLYRARLAHFRGRFTTGEEDPTACQTLYLQASPPDRVLDEVLASTEKQRELGLDQLTARAADLEQRNQMLLGYVDGLRSARTDALYFLGLAQFDAGRPSVAQTWLGRDREAAGDGPWRTGRTYNRARCLEAERKFQAAAELLLRSESPQRAGDRLRARTLLRFEARRESAPPETSP